MNSMNLISELPVIPHLDPAVLMQKGRILHFVAKNTVAFGRDTSSVNGRNIEYFACLTRYLPHLPTVVQRNAAYTILPRIPSRIYYQRIADARIPSRRPPCRTLFQQKVRCQGTVAGIVPLLHLSIPAAAYPFHLLLAYNRQRTRPTQVHNNTVSRLKLMFRMGRFF